LTTIPELPGLPEDLRQPHPRNRVGGQQVAQYFSGTDGRELVDVTDQQQMSPLRDGVDQFVGQDDVHHRRLVHHNKVSVQPVVAIVFRVAAGLQLQQAVDGAGLMAGQLGQPFGGPPGRLTQPRAWSRIGFQDRQSNEVIIRWALAAS
jgi:hypothetical protein